MELNTLFAKTLEAFGVVTVMDIHVYSLNENKKYNPHTGVTRDDFTYAGICLDTLKITNVKQSGPKKSFPAGLYNMPAIRWGKTVQMDIEDAIGRKQTLINFLGLEENAKNLSMGNKFSKAFALQGHTRLLGLNNRLVDVYITIPCFLPNNEVDLSMEAEGDFGVFDLSGVLYPVRLKDNDGEYMTYMLIQEEPFFAEVGTVVYRLILDTADSLYGYYEAVITSDIIDPYVTISPVYNSIYVKRLIINQNTNITNLTIPDTIIQIIEVT